jgi:hypothetical protein
MGEQIPFQTLDMIAEGLRRADAQSAPPGGPGSVPPQARSVLLAGERLQRAEIVLRGGDGAPREVHVYEGYWAPLTEGAVKLRDVIAFLFRGGWNGIWNAARKNGFRRWLFAEYRSFTVPGSALLALLAALGVVLGLIALNASVALAAMVRTPLKEPPRWLGDALFADLSTASDLVLGAVFVLLVSLLISSALRLRGPRSVFRRIAGAGSVVAFALVIGVTSLAGVSLPVLFWAHVQCAADGADREVLPHVLGSGFVGSYDALFERGALYFVGGALAFLLLVGAYRLLAAGAREWRAGSRRAVVYTVGLAGLLAFAAAFAGELRAAFALCRQIGSLSLVRRGISWPLLFLLSAWIRSLFVQYPGDVAAYVGSHTLDRFADLRSRVKEAIRRKARAIYSATRVGGEEFLYDGCILVGHSLGSVIAYDTLNRLILDDESVSLGQAAGPALQAAERTRLFLTFGSPLDKTAFLFGIQGKNTSEAREAVAAAVQPMICDYRWRPRRWVNVFSPWDIVSGSLDLYDLPGSTDSRRIENVADPDATTLLAAHLEYWRNPTLFRILHGELTV